VGGGAAIVEAGNDSVHARLLAVVNDIGRALPFSPTVYPINPHLLEHIPEELIERKLSPAEADGLLDRLRTSEFADADEPFG